MLIVRKDGAYRGAREGDEAAYAMSGCSMVETMRRDSAMASATGVGEAGHQACIGPKDGSIPISSREIFPMREQPAKHIL